MPIVLDHKHHYTVRKREIVHGREYLRMQCNLLPCREYRLIYPLWFQATAGVQRVSVALLRDW